MYSEADDPAPSIFVGGAVGGDGGGGGGTGGGGSGVSSRGGAKGVAPVLRAPSGCSKASCAQCGEEIALRWDDTAEEWLLLDAVAGAEGRITHSGCVA